MSFCGRSAGLIVAALALTVSIGLVAIPKSSRADDADNGSTVVARVDLVDADIQQAVNLLKVQTGIEIIIETSDTPYKRINLSLTNRSLDFVLKQICKVAGASFHQEDGVYYIGPKDAAAPAPVAPQDVKTVVETPDKPVVRTHMEKMKLNWARPSDILEYLGREDGRVNALERAMILSSAAIFQKLDKAQLQPKYPTVLQPTMSNQQTVPSVVPTSTNASNSESNRSNDNNPEVNQIGIGGGGMGGGFGGGFGGGMGGYGGGQGRGMGGGMNGMNGMGGQGNRGGMGGNGNGGSFADLIPDTRTLAYDVDNTIIAWGPDDQIRDLKEIIRLLDVPPKQLAIRADFVTATQDDVRTFGIDWSIAKGVFQANTGGTFASGDVVMNYTSGNIAAALRTSLVNGKGRLINSPTATTTNNVPVSLSLTTFIPVITSQVVTSNSGNVTVPQINTIQVGSGLMVLPRINNDNSISMVVMPFIEDIVSYVSNPAGGTIPIYTEQSISVTRRIANGETMVVGGLVKKNDTTAIHKVPLLADLPLIGSLFQSRSTTIDDSELLIFITPTIIPDRASATSTGIGVTGDLNASPKL